MTSNPPKVITPDWSNNRCSMAASGPGSSSHSPNMHLAAERYKIDLKLPLKICLSSISTCWSTGPPKNEAPRTGFHGILSYLRDSIDEARSEGYREYMMNFMSATPCPVCRGKRLRPESLAVKIGGLSIADFTSLPLNRALSAAINLSFTAREALVAERIRREVVERLEFLCAVGLNYLSWTATPQPFPAARGSASVLPPRSAPACAAYSTCSTSLHRLHQRGQRPLDPGPRAPP